MDTILVILCVTGFTWQIFSNNRQNEETVLPVVSVMPIWLATDAADVVQPTAMARDSLVVSIICPAGTYRVRCTCPNSPKPYPDKEVVVVSRPTEDGLEETIWRVAFPANDSLLVIVDADSTLFTGFLAADTR